MTPKTTNKAATAMDVAHLAGVSRSLVSMVFTHSPAARLTDETRRRIMDAARKLDYRPNLLARSLRQSRTHTIGVLQGGLGDSQTGLRIESYMQEADKYGYTIFLGLSYYDREKEWQVLRQMLDRGVDGIIYNLSPTVIRDDVAALSRVSVPLIFTEYDPLMDYPSVSFAMEPAVQEMLNDFSSNGIRNVLFMTGVFIGDDEVIENVVVPDDLRITTLSWNPMCTTPEEKIAEIARGSYDVIVSIYNIGAYLQANMPGLKSKFVYYIDSPMFHLPQDNIYGFLERPFNIHNAAKIRRLIQLIEKKEPEDTPLGEFLPMHFTRTSEPNDIPWYRKMQEELQKRYAFFNASMYL